MKYLGKKQKLDRIKPEIKTIKQAMRKKYETAYGFLYALTDAHMFKQIINLAKKYVHVKNVIIIGIGGSNLGTKAVYEALYGTLANQVRPKKVYFLDTVDTAATEDVFNIFKRDAKETLCIIITKSGDTLETIAHMETFLGFTEVKYVVISEKQSVLAKYADTHQIPILEIPHMIGGRYSVFSPVGLFPLLVLGVDIDQFVRGAIAMRKKCTSTFFNYAGYSAISTYDSKKPIIEHMFFSTYFESLGKWSRQLIAESLGKQFDRSGNEVWRGITPTIAIGSTDLHSMGQLYFGGPKDKYLNCITITEDKPLRIHIKTGILPFLHRKKYDQLMESIFYGFKRELQQYKIPYSVVELKRHPYEIGQWMMFKIFETLYLAYLYNINPFDQPNVENYKKTARKALQ